MKRLLFTIGIFVLGIGATQAQSVSTWAGGPKATAIPGGGKDKLLTKIPSPWGITKDSKGNYWISSNTDTGTILMVTPAGLVSYRAGNATYSTNGFHDGAGAGAEMSLPTGIAVDNKDSIFFCDFGNNAIRKIAPFTNIGNAQQVTTIAGGNGNLGSQSGGGGYQEGTGSGTKANKGALFQNPTGIAIDPVTNDIIVADQGNYCIRGVRRNGTTYLIAGQPTFYGSDNGTPTTCKFNSPTGIYIDAARNIYVVEGNQQVRLISYNSSLSKYDKVSAINLGLKPSPSYLLVSGENALVKSNAFSGSTFYFTNGSSIVKNNLSGSDFTTLLAGSGMPSPVTGDSTGYYDGHGAAALFNQTYGIIDISTSTTYKHLLVADWGNNAIRDIDLTGTFSGINEITAINNDGFKIYPNPANNFLNIETKSLSGNSTISLFDITGRLVNTIAVQASNTYRMSLENYPKGIYIIKVQTETDYFTGKIIVNK